MPQIQMLFDEKGMRGIQNSSNLDVSPYMGGVNARSSPCFGVGCDYRSCKVSTLTATQKEQVLKCQDQRTIIAPGAHPARSILGLLDLRRQNLPISRGADVPWLGNHLTQSAQSPYQPCYICAPEAAPIAGRALLTYDWDTHYKSARRPGCHRISPHNQLRSRPCTLTSVKPPDSL